MKTDKYVAENMEDKYVAETKNIYNIYIYVCMDLLGCMNNFYECMYNVYVYIILYI